MIGFISKRSEFTYNDSTNLNQKKVEVKENYFWIIQCNLKD